MKILKIDDTIGTGVYVGETVRDCIKKNGRRSILEILKYYDLDENILKMCHLRSLDKDNPEENGQDKCHGKAAAVAFMLFTLAYTPCLATVAELKRQFNMRIAMQSIGLGLVVAYLLAVIAFQTLRFIL